MKYLSVKFEAKTSENYPGLLLWRESRQAVKVVTVVPTKPRTLIRISGETLHW
jgi:hypothetical protein